MVAHFLKYLKDKFPINDDELEMFRQVCTVKKLRRRQYLLQEGDVWNKNAFVSKGVLRTYRVDEKGVEHIIQFSIENWWAGDRQSYHTGLPSTFNIEALEDSEIVLIPKADFDRLQVEIPKFGEFTRVLLERSFIASQNRIHASISYTAEEKYADFIKTYPDITNRIPQHMIASYLGISPETISRIRNHMVRK
ncbi:Crp/Fnr family transcriptional regulator [Chryseobacterium populi]|uniref:cAMP-binding protein n=1 Tax=Chryseobacterium populi TaxID=1144316 RepID=J2KJS3_9FLAO|nr:Crp/Fnr family transcriptional regulator [Chryseobacterium populi]EJL73328.1 cAMP-binding protein [Chryseobacterium populi]